MWETISQIVTKAFKSKTLILAWTTFALGLVGFVSGQEVIQAHPQVVAVLVTVAGVLQMVVRAVTFIPLSEKTSTKV